MSAAPSPETAADSTEPTIVTLLELVRAISEVTDDDREIVAAVRHLLGTGLVRLGGNFCGVPATDFD